MLRYLRWRGGKAARRLARAVVRRVYRDSGGDPARSIIVAGAGRSGTTWLADVLAAQLGCRMMFEPFHSRKVEAFSGFHYFHYLRPEDDDPEMLAFASRVLTGRIRHPWIDRQVEVLRPRCRLIKEIRACLFLRWLHERFPETPIFFIVRHPCAVVASRLQLGWAAGGDIEPFVRQPRLLEDHLSDQLPLLRTAATEEEKHAVVWCVSNRVPLRQFAGGGLELVFYENLLRQPREELDRIFAALGRRAGSAAFRALRRPSTTSRGASAVVRGHDPLTRWREELSEDQIGRVVRTVERFGLGHLYPDGDPLPATAAAEAGRAPEGGPR